MSLNRLMLRLAVVNALTPQPDDKYAPTIANEAVFDSRLDDLEFDQDGLIELPIIQVYTDSDENVAYSGADGEMNGYRHVLIRIIFAVGTFQTEVVDGTKHVKYGLPTTDAELEALLDIFEWQIIRALRHPTRKASLALQKICLAWDSFHSEPSRSADKNNRLAERTLTFRVRVAQDCIPVIQFEDDPGVLTPEQKEQLGVPHLPDGAYLNELIKVLATNPSYKGLINDLRELVSGAGSITVPVLRRAGLNVDAIDPADPNLLAMSNRTSGPDGRIEVQTEWNLP